MPGLVPKEVYENLEEILFDFTEQAHCNADVARPVDEWIERMAESYVPFFVTREDFKETGKNIDKLSDEQISELMDKVGRVLQNMDWDHIFEEVYEQEYE